MNYAIIEDEKFALNNLRRLVEEVSPDFNLAFTSDSIADSIEYFSKKNAIGLIFMDIELADGSCFEIFNEVDITTPIIFTTAYDEFALRAFEVNSIDYLLKPITREKITTALNKLERLRPKPSVDYARLASIVHHQPYRTRILVSSGDQFGYISVDEVAYFFSEDKYVFASLKSGKRKMVETESLAELLPVLDGARFHRISRNVITSIDAIKSVSKYLAGRLQVVIGNNDNQLDVTVSAARRKAFLDWLGGKEV